MENVEILKWPDKLLLLKVNEKLPVDNEDSVYSAIRYHFKGKRLAYEKEPRRYVIRTDPVSKQKFVIRLK